MGSLHTTTHVARRLAAVGAAAVVLALAACAGDDDAATSATDAPAARAAETEDASFGVIGQEEASGGAAPRRGDADVTTLQPAGQQLAIEASATMQTGDVRGAVERITATVAARGGLVASADIDYAAPADVGDDATSRATLVLSVPPGELAAVRSVLDDIGDVLAYDQLAEDVTDQLADLDTRIANQRASIERIRELYASAVDVDAIVRIEAELTNRETALEQLLATQQQVTDRVTMSTLTVDVTSSPAAAVAPDGDGGTGLADALGAGWSAFAGGLFALVLALAAALPFVVTLLVVAILASTLRQVVRRRAQRVRSTPSVTDEGPVRASRQG
jgi:acetolactate synthase small subunit